MGTTRAPRGVHGNDDYRDPTVSLRFPVGTHRKPAVVGVAGEAREDLGAVYDELVSVYDSPRLERCEVRSGIRLGVADAEVDLAGENFGRKISFCSSVPKLMIVGPTVLIVSIGTGAQSASTRRRR